MTFHPYISDFLASETELQNSACQRSNDRLFFILCWSLPFSHFITINSTSKKNTIKGQNIIFIKWSNSSEKFGGAYDNIRYGFWRHFCPSWTLDSRHPISKSAKVSNASLCGDKLFIIIITTAITILIRIILSNYFTMIKKETTKKTTKASEVPYNNNF